jgi:DNA-binding response OmpR family regulator
MYKIMIIEDDTALCNEIAKGLSKWDFKTILIEQFDNLLNDFSKNDPHLIIMDINLPYFDGFYWCKKIREFSKIPIIFLSSRDTNMDIVMAINMGGDDYITKPFSLDILVAKINALLRRTYSYSDKSLEVIEYKGAVLNLKDNTLLYNEKKIDLTKNEFKIILLLMKFQGKIISREKIMRTLWKDESFIDDNTLTVNVNRLRSKLTDLGLNNYITTKKGQGYVIL